MGIVLAIEFVFPDWCTALVPLVFGRLRQATLTP